MKEKVAFVCVHNSCRSQIAEALGKSLASEIFESYSAGTETKPQINQDTVRLMKEQYQIDMEETQYSKLLSEIPPVDIDTGSQKLTGQFKFLFKCIDTGKYMNCNCKTA